MPNCFNCGLEVQVTDKFCRECGKSLIKPAVLDVPPEGAPGSNKPHPAENKLSPAEMIEFQRWQKMVKGGNPVKITSDKSATVPQQAGELAKTTGDIFRSFRDISDGIKRDLAGVADVANKSPTTATQAKVVAPSKQPAKPQLSPEEMIEFEKWRQSVKEQNEQTK